MDLPTIVRAALEILLGLVGFPAALSYLLTIAERFGLDPAFAEKIAFGANVVAFVLIAYAVYTGQGNLVAVIDAALAGFAKLLADIIVILGGFALSYVKTVKHVSENRRLLLKRPV